MTEMRAVARMIGHLGASVYTVTASHYLKIYLIVAVIVDLSCPWWSCCSVPVAVSPYLTDAAYLILQGLGLQSGYLFGTIYFSTYGYKMNALKPIHHSHSSAMFTILFQVVIFSAILNALWKLLQRFIIKSTLDNIPGPPSRSLLFGNFFNPSSWVRLLIVLSNLQVFFQRFSAPKDGNFTNILLRNVWIYLSILYEQECWCHVDGSVIKIKAFLGVCAISLSIVQIGPDRRQPYRRINFLSSTQKQCIIYLSK